ncbi:PhzF family phenazine biosynthesis protein [Actinokineospora auranticolor]|uniref:PhzF family phenazine biosynthesis protein n=1 Tax=Actinokineospora auranticolor TaxID=155976 RepID=A0A2S6GHW9_9PSEU|nr:PhzF family phenazine biosynthesis protein [Actinokineospora auranticolor]PPK64832.1 PhzF family phenazine biosynthesis protein [Actinokineospora auranticolor]
MIEVHVLRVFTDEHGRFGNPLGVVLGGPELAGPVRQAIATELGYSETVFVTDPATARLRIHTPAVELPLAGHPLVGTSWLLARELGEQPTELRPELVSDPVPTFVEDDLTWIRAATADAPPWLHTRLADPAAVTAAEPVAPHAARTQLWAWSDEPAGHIRARMFAADFGVVEDEACGSATLLLAATLGREIQVHHGAGSRVSARPAGPTAAEIGGRVTHDGTITVDVPDAAAPAKDE